MTRRKRPPRPRATRATRAPARPTPTPPTPTLEGLAAQIAQLTQRIDGLTSASTPSPLPALASADLRLADALASRRGAPYESGGQRGAIAYGGGLEVSERTYLWEVERPVPALLALDPALPAEVLATLGHPQRLRLLLALIEAPRSAAELQEVIGSSSPGPLYHHLRDLLALGVVAQKDRTYYVHARHVVPLLTAVALAIDLAARRGSAP